MIQSRNPFRGRSGSSSAFLERGSFGQPEGVELLFQSVSERVRAARHERVIDVTFRFGRRRTGSSGTTRFQPQLTDETVRDMIQAIFEARTLARRVLSSTIRGQVSFSRWSIWTRARREEQARPTRTPFSVPNLARLTATRLGLILRGIASRYEEMFIVSLTWSFIIRDPNNPALSSRRRIFVRGARYLPFITARKQWLIYSPQTRTNCLWTCVYVLRKSKDKTLPDLLQGKSRRTLIEGASKLKTRYGRISDNLGDSVVFYDGSDERDLTHIAALFQVKVLVWDSTFNVVLEINKRTPPKRRKRLADRHGGGSDEDGTFHFMLYQNHVAAMFNIEMLHKYHPDYMHWLPGVDTTLAELFQRQLTGVHLPESPTALGEVISMPEKLTQDDAVVIKVRPKPESPMGRIITFDIETLKYGTIPQERRWHCHSQGEKLLYGERDPETDLAFDDLRVGTQIPYAIGIALPRIKDDPPLVGESNPFVSVSYDDINAYYVEFWGTRDNPLECVVQFFVFMAANPKYFHGATMYAHNGGKFDFPILFRWYFLTFRESLWTLKTTNIIELNGGIISFEIRSKLGTNSVKFRDSWVLLPGSLQALGLEMKTKYAKLTGTVDHDTVTADNFLDKAHNERLAEYLRNDCLVLFEVMTSYQRAVKNKMDIDVVSTMTAASLAKRVFFSRFYDMHERPVYTMSKHWDAFIRQGYFGGRVEVLRELGTFVSKIYYLDVTSLYPWVGTKALPYGRPKRLAGEEFTRRYVDDAQGTLKDTGTKVFFILCRVTTPFPLRHLTKPIHGVLHNARLVFAWLRTPKVMLLYSEEIRYAQTHFPGLYTYEYLDAVCFFSAPFLRQTFLTFARDKAEARKAGNVVLAKVSKLLANASYGYWGLRVNGRPRLKLSPYESDEWLTDLEQECVQDVFVVGDIRLWRVLGSLNTKDFSVAVASAITALARVRLHELLHALKGFYVDTDSIMTQIDLSDPRHTALRKRFVFNDDPSALGSLKNECNTYLEKRYGPEWRQVCGIAPGRDAAFDTGRFLGCKMYELRRRNHDGTEITVTAFKGFSQSRIPAAQRGIQDRNMFDRLAAGERVTVDQFRMSAGGRQGMASQRLGAVHSGYTRVTYAMVYTKAHVDDRRQVSPLEL